jgi:phosphopentomutase
MGEHDILMITADHGNDPTMPGTDHTRERVPILVSGSSIRENCDLGTRLCFADLAATVADLLEVAWHGAGCSFGNAILRHPI